jgi:hypothetical protein
MGLIALFVARKLEPIDRNQSPLGVVGRKIRQLVAPSSSYFETGNVKKASENVGSSWRNPHVRAGRSGGPSGPVGSSRESPGRLRRNPDHEGDTSPWKERAIPVPERVSDATDPFAEQRLEVERLLRTAPLPPTGNGERGA